MIVGHDVFDSVGQRLRFVEEKARAAEDDVRTLQDVAENPAVGNGCVAENFGDVNLVKFVEPVIIGLELDEPTVKLVVRADFHARQIRETMILSPDKIRVDNRYLVQFHADSSETLSLKPALRRAESKIQR